MESKLKNAGKAPWAPPPAYDKQKVEETSRIATQKCIYEDDKSDKWQGDRIQTRKNMRPNEKARADQQDSLAAAMRNRRGKIDYRILDKEKVTRGNQISAKIRTRVGHWNIRTLYSSGKAFMLGKELNRLNIKMCGISETHWTGRGRMNANGYTIWYSGNEIGGKHEHGVAIAIQSKLSQAVSDISFINDRLIKLRMKFKHADLTVIEAYAPTEASNIEDKERFYNQLQETLDKTPRHDVILLLGDFNAKVGKDFEEWGKTLGRHGGDTEENDNGYRLLELCSNNNLCITNTQFIQKPCRKQTWTSPGGNIKNLIDYIITREEWLTSIKKTRVYRTAEIGSDHFLVVAELKIKLGSKKTNHTVRYNTEKLDDENVRQQFQLKLQNKFEVLNNLTDEGIDTETEWDNFKTAVNEVAKEELGMRKKRSKKWITKETEELMENIRDAKKKNMAQDNTITRENLIKVKTQLKKNMAMDKNVFIEKITSEAEEAYRIGDSKKLFANIRNLCGATDRRLMEIEPVKAKDGETLTDKKQIIERWREYFKELL
jgi:endonuclease/exonuclease/phosphatase family metal-dependent hydrolase